MMHSKVIMIGAGPSALSAAIYTTRENIPTILYEKGPVGGLVAITDRVDNYPGFAQGVAGLDLAEQLQKQAERFGADIQYGDVSALHRGVDDTIIVTVDGTEVSASAVLIATGSDYNRLGIPGEAEYYGKGVHYCATCDGAFYRDKRLVVVGGGNSGVQEAIFLTRFANHIDLLVRSTLKASQILQNELQQYIEAGKITVHTNTTPSEIVAENKIVTKVTATSNGRSTEFMTDGVFVFIGLVPNTQFLAGSGIICDERGLIKTNQKMATNIPGVFASGDVRSGATMQVASAIGEGATAALSIREYLDTLK